MNDSRSPSSGLTPMPFAAWLQQNADLDLPALDAVVCPACRGEGWVDSSAGWWLVRCAACHGEGELAGRAYAKFVYRQQRAQDAELLARCEATRSAARR